MVSIFPSLAPDTPPYDTWWEDMPFTIAEREDPANTKSAWSILIDTYDPISNMEEAETFMRECNTQHRVPFVATQLRLATLTDHLIKTDLEIAQELQWGFMTVYPN